MPRAAVTEATSIGSGFAPAPPNSGFDGPGVAAVTITTVPESTWVVVHASGSITLVPNPDCHGFCPTTSPTFQFSPTPNVTGPVVVAANTGGPDDFFRMRGSGGAGESAGSAVGLQFVPKGAEIRARINIPESIRGFDALTGSNVASWLMNGGYGITATAVPSGIAVTESAPAPDGTITYKVAPIMDLAFFNPINLGGPAVPQGAITWNYFVGDTADHTRPSGATYEITECQFQTECRWKPPAPGRMQVHAYVEMQSVYARSNPPLDGNGSTEPQARLLVACDSSSLERGHTISCKTTVMPVKPFTIVRRTATTVHDSLNLVETPNISHPAGEVDVWEGPALVSTDLKVFVTIEGASDTVSASAHFDVTPRKWQEYRINNSRVDTAVDPGTMRPWPTDGVAIGAWYLYDLLVWRSPVLRASAGPNTGVAVLATRPEFVDPHITHIFLHPAIFIPNSNNLYSRWYRQQDGNPPGTCDQQQMLQLAQEELRHEGVTYASDSHNGVAQAWLDRERFHVFFEALSVVNQSDDELRSRAWDQYSITGMQMYDDQHHFDAADYPLIYQIRLNCVLDAGQK